ncbi:MAG: DUF1016 N-terminal domain-containing protein [Isosphaeraceae bacterium]
MSALSAQLTAGYGRGHTEKSLRHMIRFAEVFPDEAIVSAPRRELSWTQFREIICLDDSLKRDFWRRRCTSRSGGLASGWRSRLSSSRKRRLWSPQLCNAREGRLRP